MSSNLLGVVLCGGESSRMGTDKGLIKLNDTTWAQNAFNLLKLLEIDVKVSINSRQLEAYSKLFAESELVIDECTIPGPLKGILSVHKNYLNKDLYILPCDLIRMSFSVLNRLKDKYEINSPTYNLFAFSVNDRIEPLIGIYNSNLVASKLLAYINNCLYNYSLLSVIKSSNLYSLPLLESEYISLQNCNSIIDL